MSKKADNQENEKGEFEMADIRPFCAVRPAVELADKIAALPYDVYNREEACRVVEGNPLSFLRIDRAETNFDAEVSTYAPEVYAKAKELIEDMIAKGQFVEDADSCYYIYRLTMNGRAQSGIVACSSVDDYCNNVIMKHENTREEKEVDRIRHIDTTSCQTGPIFLAFRDVPTISNIMEEEEAKEPLYCFTADDGVEHCVWKISSTENNEKLQAAFSMMDKIYIADGHHRCASAVKVGLQRRKEGVTQESDYFLSVLFPESELKILDYNRVLKDLNGKTVDDIMDELKVHFAIEESDTAVAPAKKGEFGMILDDKWYKLTIKDEFTNDDPVEGLDVSLLQNYVLDPIFGIKNPKTDNRIDFVGGIRGLGELERRNKLDCSAAFSMYPTSIEELFAVADEGKLMPPKSTWFEPKLRSGLFIHKI